MPTFDFTAPDGTTHSIEGPEGATREQAFHMLQLKLGGQSAPAAPALPEDNPSLGDAAKSVGSGLAQGTATALGLPGDLATLAHAAAPQALIDKVKAVPGAQWLYNHLPTSQAVLDSATDPLVDPNYQPQSTLGRDLQAVSKNAGPGLASGMGVAPTVVGALAGQTLYDATGSHLAEAGGNLAGSVLTPLALARRGRQALQALKDAKTVAAEANAQYANPLIRDTTISPQAAQGVAGDMDAALSAARSKFTSTSAPKVNSAIDNLANAGPTIGPPAPVSIEDLHILRKDLGKMGQETRDFKPTEQAVAAGTAKRVLDQYLDNIPSRDVIKGNPIDAVQALRDANANWRYANSASKIGNIIQKAADKAGSQGSGLNYGNLQRQGLLPLLDNNAAKLKAMGMGSPDEIDAVRTATQGDLKTNVQRMASNMLGGGGGVASTLIGHVINPLTGGVVGGEEGYRHGGFLGGLAGTAAGMVAGQTLRRLANANTRKSVKAIEDAILAKAPANAPIVAANTAAKAANSAATKAGLNKAAKNALIQSLLQSGRLYVSPNRNAP